MLTDSSRYQSSSLETAVAIDVDRCVCWMSSVIGISLLLLAY
ncbi:hypothetical protein VB773_20280 [Haloarculaceae archaeon H-GB2-1]|nr:hypothetical protein [Haloarculaceae archaeon H-GB1-1]MEA5409681.1 hypothetical protein [Haloarculaceae archaeon H-GB2-1]